MCGIVPLVGLKRPAGARGHVTLPRRRLIQRCEHAHPSAPAEVVQVLACTCVCICEFVRVHASLVSAPVHAHVVSASATPLRAVVSRQCVCVQLYAVGACWRVSWTQCMWSVRFGVLTCEVGAPVPTCVQHACT